MTERHLITREIGIDAGHRVTYHGSKCRNLHGHRYTIQATCEGPLYAAGEQQGMVLDFGFLKEEMMTHIDEPCDHGMILWQEDPLLRNFAGIEHHGGPEDYVTEWVQRALDWNATHTSAFLDKTGAMGKIYVVPFVPTAENLAKHWYDRLAPAVEKRTDGQATLHNIKVWETPNCSAQYPLAK
jgi:6-pyruvoyltetrahydropterin/6-carboxytetrahydropterin synthase